MKKNKVFYVVTLVLAVLCFIFALFIPETGKHTLLNEIFGLLLICFIDAVLIKGLYAVFKTKEIRNIILITLIVLIMSSVAGIKLINVMKDTIQGPQTISLYDCKLEKRGTSRGIFSLNYYLHGIDENGTEYRLKISGDDYNSLRAKKEITVSCYVNTGRILDLEKGSESHE